MLYFCCDSRDHYSYGKLSVPKKTGLNVVNANRSSLVVEDDVRSPDNLWGDSDGGDIFIFLRVPAEFVVIPFLQESNQTWIYIFRLLCQHRFHLECLTCLSQTFVVIIWFFSSCKPKGYCEIQSPPYKCNRLEFPAGAIPTLCLMRKRLHHYFAGCFSASYNPRQSVKALCRSRHLYPVLTLTARQGERALSTNRVSKSWKIISAVTQAAQSESACR